MPYAARLMDISVHAGKITLVIPSNKVMVEGMSATTLDALHTCTIPPPHPPVTKFVAGSTKVLIQGRPALRATDTCGCGATSISGAGAKKVQFS